MPRALADQRPLATRSFVMQDGLTVLQGWAIVAEVLICWTATWHNVVLLQLRLASTLHPHALC